MCDRYGPYYDHGHDQTEEEFEEEQQYWYDQLAQKHAEEVERNYEQHLRELQEAAFERSETFIDV